MLTRDRNGHLMPAARLPGLANQELTVGAASVQSAAFNANTTYIRLATTTACRFLVGRNPTALATSAYLPANAVEYFGVNPGDKVAVIQDTAGGKITVTEL